MKKALSLLLAIALVGSLCLMNVSAAANETDGQTVISREFLVNLFENPWQDEDGAVVDAAAQAGVVNVPMIDPEDKSQVGANIPCAVGKINVKVGDSVEKNQTLVTIEAMKMETAITARMSGVIASIDVREGDTVKGGQLLLTLR